MKLCAVGLVVLIFIAACAPMPIPTQTAPATQVIAPTLQRVRAVFVAPTDTPTGAATSTRAAAVTPTPQVVWRGDLHMHTVCSDGANTYDEMAQRAIDLHFDFIAITDHVGIAERDCHNESLIKCAAETRLVCFPGAELTARLHLLAIGIHQRIDPKLPLNAWVAEIHRQGGLAIAAHPYDPRWKYTEDELYHSGLDAMECARGKPADNQLQWQLSDRFNLPCVYNSDAHYRKDLGWRYNVCSVPIKSLADLKAALIARQCRMN